MNLNASSVFVRHLYIVHYYCIIGERPGVMVPGSHYNAYTNWGLGMPSID